MLLKHGKQAIQLFRLRQLSQIKNLQIKNIHTGANCIKGRLQFLGAPDFDTTFGHRGRAARCVGKFDRIVCCSASDNQFGFSGNLAQRVTSGRVRSFS